MTSTYPVIKGALLSSEHYTWNTADTLGRGASAIVYLGRHKVSGKVVAVKVFHDHVAQSYKSDDLRELELLKRLDHQNIIRFLAIEKELSGMRPVLVTEYCEGGSLHHMLDQPTHYYGLSEQEFLLVLSHVAAGIQYLRSSNVVHRDIKPGNIMRYISDHGFSIYKLTDFGAARDLNEDESFHSLYGTEEYLHPGIYERAVLRLPTKQSFDARVDLWSLGVTFYHTATGELPFQPYGGRSNRETMFTIITQKESGVISGVQTKEKGPIEWKRDLPGTSPLSSGLKSIIIPLLAGLMEPDQQKMISYDSFFRIVNNIEDKITIDVFYFSRCEQLKIYADKNITMAGLQDLIASLTDIVAKDQVLLVSGGKSLEDIIDPVSQLHEYPPNILTGSIYLFQKETPEGCRLPTPVIPDFPSFRLLDMDMDARLAHSCAARGELIRRETEQVVSHQDKLMDGLLAFRVYVENRLVATKGSHDFMKQLMDECREHFDTFFQLVGLLRGLLSTRQASQSDLTILDDVIGDQVIRQVHAKASERINEIEQYREQLIRKLEEVKNYATKFTAVCLSQECSKKVSHHMSTISSVQSRFRRDKNVKHQMTLHDETIHKHERNKLETHCATMKSILADHCLMQREKVYRNGMQICESLTKCLGRVMKIEKNINSVLNCQKLLSEKVIKLRTTCMTKLQAVADSGFVSVGGGARVATEALRSAGDAGLYLGLAESGMKEDCDTVSSYTQSLRLKLVDVEQLLGENTKILHELDRLSIQSSGSFDPPGRALSFYDDKGYKKTTLQTSQNTFGQTHSNELRELNSGSSSVDTSFKGLHISAPHVPAFSINATPHVPPLSISAPLLPTSSINAASVVPPRISSTLLQNQEQNIPSSSEESYVMVDDLKAVASPEQSLQHQMKAVQESKQTTLPITYECGTSSSIQPRKLIQEITSPSSTDSISFAQIQNNVSPQGGTAMVNTEYLKHENVNVFPTAFSLNSANQPFRIVSDYSSETHDPSLNCSEEDTITNVSGTPSTMRLNVNNTSGSYVTNNSIPAIIPGNPTLKDPDPD